MSYEQKGIGFLTFIILVVFSALLVADAHAGGRHHTETVINNYQNTEINNAYADSGAMAGLDFSINYKALQVGAAVGYAESQTGETTNGLAVGAAKRFKFSEDTAGLGSVKAQFDEGGGKKVVGSVIVGF